MKLRPINLDELAKVRDGTGHSIFGPSSSKMWLNCAGSLIPNLLAKDDAGEDAAYGTVAHGVTEEWLKSGKAPKHLIDKRVFVEAGEWGYMITIDEEMLEYARMCVDWIELLPGTHMIERRVDFSRITPIPNQKGTADFITVYGDEMWVVDWKFGKGHRVYAENNTQGMFYALGSLWEFDPECKVKTIHIWIGQPRLDHFDMWSISRDDLLMFAGEAKVKMANAWRLDAPRVAGPAQCQFCRIQSDCAANAKMQAELTEGVFEAVGHEVSVEDMQAFKDRLDHDDFTLDPIDMSTLTTAELLKLKPFHKAADKWWSSLELTLLKRQMDGESIEQYGWKTVEGRSNRKFRSEAQAAEHLMFNDVPETSLYKKKFISPAEAEKALIKAGHRRKDLPRLLDGLTTKPPGKPVIVPLSDKREAMGDITEGVFEALQSETTEDEDI